jgi:hypothetical protein
MTCVCSRRGSPQDRIRLLPTREASVRGAESRKREMVWRDAIRKQGNVRARRYVVRDVDKVSMKDVRLNI